MGVHVLYITTQNQNLHTSSARQASQESRKVDEQALSRMGGIQGRNLDDPIYPDLTAVFSCNVYSPNSSNIIVLP